MRDKKKIVIKDFIMLCIHGLTLSSGWLDTKDCRVY